MNKTVDTVYIALELTKIYFQTYQNSSTRYTAMKFVNVYKEILCSLLDVEKLPDVEALEIENGELKEAIRKQVPVGLSVLDVEDLLALLTQYKGDMEPVVYSNLYNFIQLRGK